jgi:hypothetical protein
MVLLTGSVRAFRVQEILSLVGRKPGQWLLRVQGEHTAFVGLRDGAVVSASADASRQCLARRLVLEGAVGTTSLATALRSARDGGVVRALANADAIDPEQLQALSRQHVVSAIATLSHMRDGTFSADLAEELPDDVGMAFALTDIAGEVTGLLKRWRPAADLLGGSHTVMAAHPGEVPAHLRGLHSLIDGRRTVAELVEASGHGTVGTVVDLADLVQADCAVPVVAGSGAVEQRLAMLSAVEDVPVTAARPSAPHLAVIPGGSVAEDKSKDTAATSAQDDGEDLLTVILRGVRSV